MYKKSTYVVTFFSALCLVCVARADITEGLVGYWPLDGDATDASGNGLNGTMNGNLTPTTDRFGNAASALLFPGATNSYIELGDPPALQITGAMTLAAWVRIDSYESNGRIIARIGSTRSYSLNVEGEQYGHVGAFQVAASGSDLRIVTTADRIDFGPDEWFHIAGTFEPSVAMKIYINGELDNTMTDNVPDTQFIANTVRIGRSGTTWGEFAGSIDEVRVYDRALSADDIYELGTTLIATSPSPADGTENVTELLFEWQAGDTAVFHNVYLGTNPDLGPADLVTTPNYQYAMYWHLPGFIPGATYYWRVDEVEVDGTTTHTGHVWSFTAAPLAAYNPSPADGARYVATDVVLSWEPGFTAVKHDVYFGTDETAVTNGTGGTLKASQTETTYTPEGLVKDTTYYWRIDEVESNMTTKHTGAVWSFRTVPDIAVRDPNMIGWWKLDEGAGTTAIDSSGHDHHGTFTGDPQWVVGYDGGALEFDGEGDDRVSLGTFDVQGSGITIACWFKADNLDTPGNDPRMFSKAVGGNNDQHWFMVSSSRTGSIKVLRFRLKTDGATGELKADTDTGTIELNEWIHVVATWDGSMMRIYKNGLEVGSLDKTGTLSTNSSAKVAIGNQPEGTGDRPFDGIIDDVRLYNKGVTAAEIPDIMRGDPTLAWKPEPADRSVPDIDQATTLSWTPGENAARHDVYFGTDRDAVEDADTTTTDIYRGRQDPNTYTPPEGVEFNESYYWRIDEFNTDATVSKGRVWTFTVAEYLIIDDFEPYDDYCKRIFYTWPDGWGHNGDVSCGVPAYGGNGTGSTVGYLQEPYAEQIIIHGGEQSMPFEYLNDGSTGKALYSETERTFDPPQDWTRHGVKALTLWFRGLPGSVGSFSYDAGTGIYTMTADGADIWDQPDFPGAGAGNFHDEFHYAYKQLSGVGTIEAQVLSVQNTNGWAKAGVMIRETLDANSVHAMTVVTPSEGVSFQHRNITGDTSGHTTQGGIQAPHWVRLTRSGNDFTAEHSADGTTWETIGTQNIPMAASVYVGLALTSHNTDPTVACTATFSDVTITGTVTGQWQSQDIGITSNDAEQLYVALEDSTGTAKDVPHPDPNAAQLDTWQEWNIDLADFAPVDITRVKKMYIGVGDRDAPESGGAGMLYIDDIRLYQPRCFPDLARPAADLNGNCVVDYPDLQILTDEWLSTGFLVAPQEPSTASLVAYYAFENNTQDGSGNGHHGTAQGAAVYVPWSTRYGMALEFNGAGDLVDLGTFDVVGPGITLSAWIRPDDFDVADARVISKATGSGGNDHFWMLSTISAGGETRLRFRLKTDDGQGTATLIASTGGLAAGEWAHVAATWDGSTMRLYKSGEEVGSMGKGGSAVATDPTVSVAIGNQPANATGGTRDYDGLIDEAHIYSRALPEAEILWLAGTTETISEPFDLNVDGVVDFKDYAILAGTWLQQQLWP